MSEGTTQCWLVERTFDDRNLVNLTYATPDGTRYIQQERSESVIRSGRPVTAAIEVDETMLAAVDDEETEDWYAEEADRTASEYDPDEEI